MKSDPFPTIPGGVCAPQGFLAHAISCGIKNPASTKLDLALIYSEAPCTAAGVFTRNQVQAAPVRVCRDHLVEGTPRAIIANSGNANACTGVPGTNDALEMTRAASGTLDLAPQDVFVCSTGIIGLPLPMDRIRPRFAELRAGLNPNGSDAAARAIMTSDTRPKEYAIEVDGVRIGGIAKGAGMIRPDMATMLAFVTTDAAISAPDLQALTRKLVVTTFNAITIDGDTSTNDSLLVLANGLAGPIDPNRFRAGLAQVFLELAKMIVRDGERVTKFVEVRVEGAASPEDARRVASAVANSNLVKASWNGEDPNWGRVIHAVGYSGARLDPYRIDIDFGDLPATRNGVATTTPLEALIEVVRNPEFTIRIDLHQGPHADRIFSSDLSPEYIDFNRSEYALLKNRKAT